MDNLEQVEFQVQNFGFLDVQYVSVVLTKIKKKKEQYIAAILIHIECDEESTCTQKAVHIECDMVGTRDEVVVSALTGLASLFDPEKILDTVLVFDKHGDQLDEFSLNDMAAESQKKSPLVRRGS